MQEILQGENVKQFGVHGQLKTKNGRGYLFYSPKVKCVEWEKVINPFPNEWEISK